MPVSSESVLEYGEAHLVELSLLLSLLFKVQLHQSLVTQHLELLVGVLQLRLHDLLILMVLTEHLKSLVTFMPGSSATDGVHSIKTELIRDK